MVVDGARCSTKCIYAPNGTFSSSGQVTKPHQPGGNVLEIRSFSVSGTWRVEGNKLFTTCTVASEGLGSLVGQTESDEILKLTDSELITRDPKSGQVETSRRVSE